MKEDKRVTIGSSDKVTIGSLTKIDVTLQDLSEEEVSSFAEELKNNTTLTSLSLTLNSLGDKGVGLLADALKHNRTLKRLLLNSNEILHGGAKSLAEALETNRGIEELYLYGNMIGYEGAEYLADMLKTNTNITVINLASNCIRDKGAEAIIEMLKFNKTLKSIDVSKNTISDPVIDILIDAVEQNDNIYYFSYDQSFVDLDLEGNRVPKIEDNMTVHGLKALRCAKMIRDKLMQDPNKRLSYDLMKYLIDKEKFITELLVDKLKVPAQQVSQFFCDVKQANRDNFLKLLMNGGADGVQYKANPNNSPMFWLSKDVIGRINHYVDNKIDLSSSNKGKSI